MLDADRPMPMFPPSSRLEYTYGDSNLIVEVPPEHSEALITAWETVVKNLICERFGLPMTREDAWKRESPLTP
jgi:hypothetical protein